jgi:hypothetical protein
MYDPLGINQVEYDPLGINKITPSDESVADKAKGVGEAALSTLTGAVSWIPSGLVKSAGLLSGQLKEGSELGDYLQEKLTYKPTTETGKKLAGYVSKPFEYISEKSQEAGDWAYDKTGSPLIGATVRTSGEAIPFVVPAGVVKGVKGIKTANKSLGMMKDVVPETQGKPVTITPEIPRQERVSSEFTKSVLEPPYDPLQIIQKKDWEYANKNTELIDRQTQMFEDAALGKINARRRNVAIERPIETKPVEVKPVEVLPEKVVEPVVEPKADLPSAETVTPSVKPTVAEVKPELPTMEGEFKPHRTAQRVEMLSKDGFGEDIAKYQPEEGMIKAEQAKGDSIVAQGYESAINDLMRGKTPEGVRPGTMISAVSREAVKRGDTETIWKLGTTSEIHTVGQEIAKDLKSFDQGLSNNPVTAIHSIVKARKEELVKTGQKIDPVKQNAEIERLNKALQDTQKALDDHIAKTAKATTTYGSRNKIVTQSEYLKVKEELRAQFGSQLSAGLDPTIAAKLGKIGVYHLEAGTRSFAVWSERVIADVGEWVKPHLEDLWQKSNESVGINLKRYKTRLSNETSKITGKLENLDFAKQEKRTTALDAEGRKLRDIRDRVKVAYDAAVRKTGTVTREEAAKVVDLARTAAELKSKYDPNVKTNHGFPSERDRFEYGRAQVAFERYVAALKEGDQSLATLAKNRVAEFKTTAKENPAKAVKDLAIDLVGEISDSSIALVASLDNSFVGRQGLLTLQTHPTVWLEAAKKSFSDIYKALRDKHGNEVAKDILHADLVSRANYINGNYHKAGILAKFEEQYPTSHPSRVPYLGRAFKASEVSFTNTALRMRIGTFDLLLDMAKKQDLPINKTLIEDIGTIVNSATARAKTHDSKLVKNILWAPKMMLANYNVLTGHTLGAGLKSSFARKQSAYNWMKMVGETAAVVAVLNALNPGSVETDPRSSDFLKYRDGNTRIDLTAGRGQYLTLAARWYTGQSKNAQTKIITDLSKSGFGDRTYFDVGLDFLTNKTTPFVRQGISIAKNQNFEGKKPTPASILADLTVPIPVKNFYGNLFGDYPDKSATALIGNLADVFGVNANTYQPLTQWDNSTSDKIEKYRKRVGEETFNAKNIKFNLTKNNAIDKLIETKRYNSMSDEAKQKEITKLKAKERQKIIGF